MRAFPFLTLALIGITGFSLAVAQKRSRNSERKRSQAAEKNVNPKSKIVDPDDHTAELHQYPSVVSIQKYHDDTDNWKHECVGTIINKRTILSSGHCVQTCDDHCKIVAGAHDLRNAKEQSQSTYTSKCSDVHPEYNNDTSIYDYGVIYTGEPIVFEVGVVEKLILPETSSDISTKNCMSPCWGFEKPGKLQHISVKMYPRETCEELHDILFLDKMICGYHSDNKNQWWDFGAPLLCDGTLAGISSWAYAPWGSSGYPAVFSEVAEELDWIKSKVKASCPKKD